VLKVDPCFASSLPALATPIDRFFDRHFAKPVHAARAAEGGGLFVAGVLGNVDQVVSCSRARDEAIGPKVFRNLSIRKIELLRKLRDVLEPSFNWLCRGALSSWGGTVSIMS
jgi:hypothetical protein